jgi:hypothetical protein
MWRVVGGKLLMTHHLPPATHNPPPMKLTKLELILLSVNLFVLGGLVVLMTLRGPSTASVLLLVGTLGIAIGKIGRAWTAGA